MLRELKRFVDFEGMWVEEEGSEAKDYSKGMDWKGKCQKGTLQTGSNQMVQECERIVE
jgi:hypothetical protein